MAQIKAKKSPSRGPAPLIRFAADPLPERNVHFVIHGKPGMGKTSLGFTFKKPLIIDSNSGIDRAYSPLRKDAIPLGKDFSFGAFYDWVMSESFEVVIDQQGYSEIVFDTIGSLLDNHIAPFLISTEPKYGTRTGGLSMSGWGAMATTFNLIKSRIWNLGLDIISICHSKEEGEGAERQWELAIKGGTSDAIYESADQIGFLHFVGGKRTLGFQPGGLYIAKNTAGIEDLEIPDASRPEYASIGNELLEAIKAALVSESSAQIELKAEIQEWRTDLEEADKPATFDALIEAIAEMTPQQAALKSAVKKMLADQLKKRGWVYNKDTGKVEEANAAKQPQTEPEDEPQEEVSE